MEKDQFLTAGNQGLIKLEKCDNNNESISEYNEFLDSTANHTQKNSEIGSPSDANEENDSFVLEVTDDSDAEIDIENNTINETIHTPEKNTNVTGSRTATSKMRINDKMVARKLIAAKLTSKSSLNQSTLLDYFSKSNSPFKRSKSLPKATNGYFTRSKHSSFKMTSSDTSALNMANSTLMSDTSALNVSTNSNIFDDSSASNVTSINVAEDTLKRTSKIMKLKDCITKCCLKCNKTFKNDKKLRYCKRCKLILKHKCGLCHRIFGTLQGITGHLAYHSQKKSENLGRSQASRNSPNVSWKNSSGLYSENNMLFEYICLKCNQTYKSTKNCKMCQIECHLKCLKCNRTYQGYSGLSYHYRHQHETHPIHQNESVNDASTIDVSTNVEGISSSRKRKMVNNDSTIDSPEVRKNTTISRKRKVADVSGVNKTENTEVITSPKKRKAVDNVSAARELENAESTSGSENIQMEEELKVKEYMFLNCLNCDVTIQNHTGNIILCKTCNVDMVLRCFICSKYYKTISESENHLTTHQSVSSINVINQESTNYAKCLKCLKLVPKNVLTLHKRHCKRMTKFSCKFCTFETKLTMYLLQHAVTKHMEQIDLKDSNVRLMKLFFNLDIRKQRKRPNNGNNGFKKKNNVSYPLNYKGHVKWQTGSIFKCELCPYKTKKTIHLAKHIVNLHQTDSIYDVANLIDETYNAELLTETNTNIHEDKKIAVLDSGSTIKVEVASDTDSMLSSTSKSIKNEHAINKSINSNNSNSVLLYCPRCKETKGVSKTSGAKRCDECNIFMRFKCAKCNKQYKFYQSLIYHINATCNVLNWYNCDQCDYKTPLIYQLERHVHRMHPVQQKHEPSEEPRKIMTRRSLSMHEQSAKIQPIKAVLKSTFKDNQAQAENDMSLSKVLRRKSMICLKCNSKITDAFFHNKFCGKEPHLFCALCPFRTKYRSSFRTHLKAFHEESFKMNQDDNSAGRNADSQLKLKILNEDTAKYMEEYCVNCCGVPQMSATKSISKCKKCKTNLLYRCVKCSVMYPRREFLLKHVKRHLSNALKCNTCSKCFGIAENLRKHEIICKARMTC